MNLLKISFGNAITYLNMDKVKYIVYNQKIKTLSFCLDEQNVIDGIFVDDKMKLQLEKLGIFLNEVQK